MATKFLIFSENIYPDWQIEEQKYINIAKKLLKFYISKPEVYQKSALCGHDYNTVSFDFLYCDSRKTHEINREYRNKDYPADIITFAIFADDENSFIFDGDINLGEIVIALDKVIEGVNRDISHSKNKEQELFFLISHGLMHLLGFDHQEEEEYNFVVGEQRKALESIEYDKI